MAWLRESLGRTTDAPRDPQVAAVRADTLEGLGAAYRDGGDAGQAFLYYQEALEIRRVAGDEAAIATCRNHLGSLCYRTGKFEEAASHFESALATRRAQGDRRGVASTLNNLAGTCLLLGRLKEAAAHFEESRTLAQEIGDRRRVASILANMGLLRSYEGRVEEAEELQRASLAIHRERDDPVGIAHALNNMSDLAVERGRLEEAIAWADEAIETWTRAGRHEALPKPWVNRGRALVELDRLTEAREAAETAAAAADRSGSEEYRAEANALLARVLAREGEDEAALHAATNALSAAERARSPALRAQCLTQLGRLHVDGGRLEDAKRELEQATRLVRGLPHPYDRACILAEQGRLLARAGSAQAGAERMRRALAEFETLGNARGQVRALVDLAVLVEPDDAAEAERLRMRARRLAGEHDLGDLPSADPADAAGASGRIGVDAERLRALAESWQAGAPAERRPVDVVDPFFRWLKEAHRVSGAELRLGGSGLARSIAAEPDGTFAHVDRSDGKRARFVLKTSGEPASEGVAHREVHMGTAGSAALRIARDRAFDDEEILSIEAVSRLVTVALEGPLHRVAGAEAARPSESPAFEGLVGSSAAMELVKRRIAQVAPTDSSVLLLGESGTGKELAARAIHARSSRASGPFVAINCPSIPRELIEAELFGHEKGAFTGATTTRPGKVELADGGTLFLDEVGDMAPATQVRLLRFLEEREFQRVGGRENRHVDVRILAATSRDLADAVQTGDFRSDLYYRLNVVPLRMPGLRERREDVAPLVRHLLSRVLGHDDARLSERALARLTAWDWPGNVRELRNAVEHMVALGGDALLDEEHLPDGVRGARGGTPEGAAGAGAGSGRGGAGGGGGSLRAGESLEARLRELEAVLIRSTLEAEGWNQSAAARRLGITESKVRNRMRDYGIHRPSDREDAS
jgi:sigma-54 specific flagellar transcriptional regulator A